VRVIVTQCFQNGAVSRVATLVIVDIISEFLSLTMISDKDECAAFILFDRLVDSAELIGSFHFRIDT
jgi:hypothetical protein